MRFRLMKTFLPFLLIMAFLLLVVPIGVAQELQNVPGNSFKDNWAIQFQPGFSQFYGDAANHNYFQKFKGEIGFSAEISGRKMIFPAWGVGLQFGYDGLKSYKDQKNDGTKVDFRLNGNYFDAGLFVYVNFNHLFAGYKPHRRFTAYGTIGAGWGFWNSTLTDGITGLAIKSGSTIGGNTFKTNAFVVPVSLGLNYRFSDRWCVNLGGTLRTVFNDDVDVWHDGFKYDQIFSTNVGITYHIGAGWGRNSRKQKSSKQNPCCKENKEKRKDVIPIYDFDQVTSKPARSSNNKVPQLSEAVVLPKQPEKSKLQGVIFKVQIMAKTNPLPKPSSLQSKYHLPYPVEVYHQDGLYRYAVGTFYSYDEALNASRSIKQQGVFDAFVTAYRNGYRISISQIMKKINVKGRIEESNTIY